MEQFEKLCGEEYQSVRKFLLRLCGDETLAEELTQETFYQAMRGWKKFRGQCAPTTWLCGIAKRQYFLYCRKPRPVPVEQLPESPGETLEDRLMRKETRMEAHRLLHDLPEPYKEVLTLRTFGELNHEEIGALFGKTASWARVTYYRGRQMLAAMLEGEMSHE